jgi:hypothetical protein
MDQDNLNTILTNVLQNVFKLKDVSNIIGSFSIHKNGNYLHIKEKLVNDSVFITYYYKPESFMVHYINKCYKNIYLSNNPKKIDTNKFSCIYYNSIKHIRIVYPNDRTTDLDYIYLYKDLKHNLTQYIYRTDYDLYAFINKYKINNLIYKKNVKPDINKPQLILLNELFIHYNFARSYNIFYLL